MSQEEEKHVVTDYKLKKDIDMYQKMGLSYEYATIVACNLNGVPERAQPIIDEMKEEQQEIEYGIKDFIPLHESIKINTSPTIITDVETKVTDN